jgi:manganese oxidase
MSQRSYHVVAMSFPIVYTLEGDHDRDGMLFALKPVSVLLKWAKDLWYADDKLLPGLHWKRQRAQLVIDGFERLELMLHRLRAGPDEDRKLLSELILREQGLGDMAEHGDADCSVSSHRAKAVRHNVQRQIDDLHFVLNELGDLQGPKGRRDEAAEFVPGEPLETAADKIAEEREEPQFKLVTLTPEERQEWREHWKVQAELLDRAIARWFSRIEGGAGLESRLVRLATHSGIPLAQVKALLLNDYTPGTARHLPPNRFNPMKPIEAARPIVLRACEDDKVEITVENSLTERRVGFHVQGDGLSSPSGDGVRYADGSDLRFNQDSTIAPRRKRIFRIDAKRQGVWPINDLADVRGNESGTNAHGLFGALVVEPKGSNWIDPVSGNDLTNADWSSQLDVMVIAQGEDVTHPAHKNYVDFHTDTVPRSFREFTVFIHDEPEVHSGLHTVGEHSIMPLSYRAEPMHNRLPHRMRHHAEATLAKPLPSGPDEIDRTAIAWDLSDELAEEFWTARNSAGEYLERVSGEEQHHSSWLFGDPVTHIQRAYAGDPCRVRLVHAGVKETHVYHLHVHEWHAVASDSASPSQHPCYEDGKAKNKGSHLLDSITIGPQTGMTIDPLFGSGSRQHAIGDIIWHCHLYPHFHHGMWGLWRSFDRFVDGARAFPDGSHCPPLQPLPGRKPPASTADQPGFPWFIDGVYPMKSPPPPAAKSEQRNGRRILLKMPDASPLEIAAMHPDCRSGDTPGALFVPLDTQARQWNSDAGLPPPRIIRYDSEMRADHVDYNVDGWHDPITHHYRLAAVEIQEADAVGAYHVTHSEVFDEVAGENPTTLFPRANHGDIVEWRHRNLVNSFPADGFDLPQHPVECGLHVHLVKFDVLAADGSSTGWNYLSGASCREAVGEDRPGEMRTTSLHRWVVDEEFGPCFFHDHLLANFRQKHGLFSALICEPPGSQWLRADDQSKIAWGETEAVIVPPPESGLPPFREACLAIGDFVPLLDKHGNPLNPPGELSGDDDPGSMGVNYRSAPLTFRGDDPSQWFSSHVRSQFNFSGEKGDPDTPVIRTYPGERLRIRLIQGSHEEQHSFTAHGLRWRCDWGNASSTLVNQQSLGISEAFTIDINPEDASAYGVGDHLWHFSAMDDIWLGCWGMVRALAPTPANFARWSPLPNLEDSPAVAREKLRRAKSTPPAPQKADRTFVVVAQRTEHLYAGRALTDPWGLIYRTVDYTQEEFEDAYKAAIADDRWKVEDVDDIATPLVLRARRGEWIRVILVNDLMEDEAIDDEEDGGIDFGPEPSPARLPLEKLDDLERPAERKVSTRVSIHASLLGYDVGKSDSSYVGLNPDTTVASAHRRLNGHAGHGAGAEGSTVVDRMDHHTRRNWREYWWYADPALAPEKHEDGPGQVCFLHDMADIRNHRHHGLIGALVVEPGDVTPYTPQSRSSAKKGDGWTGLEAELRDSNGKCVAHETTVFMQDGLRFFVNGNPDWPMPDENPTDDPEDSGQKGINYRSHPVHRGNVARDGTCPDPLATVSDTDTLWLRIIGAGDKPRQQTFTLHGCAWPQAPWHAQSPWIGAFSGMAPCRAENIVVKLHHNGSYAARSGVFRWGTEHGIWSSIRKR